MVDGSGSVSPANWEIEQRFTKKAAAVFAERNLFKNGGTATYVKVGWRAEHEGTFTSLEDFEAHVDADTRTAEGTNIGDAMHSARLRLNANPSTANFMIVLTDGNNTHGEYPGIQAALVEDEGTITFAVGVGKSRGGGIFVYPL